MNPLDIFNAYLRYGQIRKCDCGGPSMRIHRHPSGTEAEIGCKCGQSVSAVLSDFEDPRQSILRLSYKWNNHMK